MSKLASVVENLTITQDEDSTNSAALAEPVTSEQIPKKILIIGRADGFIKLYIRKMRKLNHTIFQLTDEGDKSSRNQGVFERYKFDLTTDSIREVIDSVKPDNVIFAGAYDSAYDLSKNSGAISYVSTLMNVLISCTASGVSRFIYLSSSEVFEGNFNHDIDENQEMSPRSMRSLVLAQAEDICLRHSDVALTDVTIVRFDNLYGIPNERSDALDFCSSACLKLLIENKISYNEKINFSCVYFSDAAEGLFRIMSADARSQRIYHITGNCVVNQKQFADILSELAGVRDIALEDLTIGEQHRIALDGHAAQSEFEYSPFCDFRESVSQVYKYIKKHLNHYLTEDEKKKRSLLSQYKDRTRRIIHVLSGLFENLLVFALVFMLDRTTANSGYFDRLDFYLLYTLAFAVIYGRQMAIFSTVLSVIGYGITQAGVRGGFTVLVDFNTYIWVAQLFIVAMVVGHIKEQIAFVTDDKDEEIQYLNKQLSEIEEINDSNKRIKHIMEYRLVNYTESLGMLYDMISQIECMQPGRVLFRCANTVSKILSAQHVSVYLVSGYYARLHAATSKEAARLGKSIKYGEFGAMSKAFSEGRVFINNTLETTLPSMAYAVNSPIEESDGSRKIDVLILIWNLEIEQMTLRQANILTVIGQIVSGASYRAKLYLEALVDKNYIGDTRVLHAEAFSEILSMYEEAQDEAVAEFTVIYPLSGGKEPAAVAEIISSCIRASDYIGIKDGKLCLLLTNTSIDESKFVIARFAEKGLEASYDENDGDCVWNADGSKATEV